MVEVGLEEVADTIADRRAIVALESSKYGWQMSVAVAAASKGAGGTVVRMQWLND